MALYISNISFPSIEEADAFQIARSIGVLPADAWTEGVDDRGGYIAFLSEDAAFCEAVNGRIKGWRKLQEVKLRNSEHGSYSEEDIQEWLPRGFHMAFTPQRGRTFTGWTKVRD